MEDKRIIGFVILVMISIILLFVMVYNLNKDYKFNGGKKAISSSRYRKIAFCSSIALLASLISIMRILVELYVSKYSVSDGIFRLLLFVFAVLFPVFFVESLKAIVSSNYKKRMHKSVKDDKNDCKFNQEKGK